MVTAQSVYSPPRARSPWRLEDLLPKHEARYYSHGRWALAEALRMAGVGPGASVLFPEFFCREVLAPAHALGALPVFYPVDESLEPSRDPEDWPKAKAVVAVNFFGFPQDLRPFWEYAGRTGAVLIEDNAHGLFSRDADGRALGGRAGLGVFSLRKTVPLPDGAALVSPKNGIWTLPPQAEFSRHFRPRPAAKAALRRAAGVVGFRPLSRSLALWRELKAARPAAADPDAEKRMPADPRPCAAWSRPVAAADPGAELSRRRELYALARDVAVKAGAVPVFSHLPEGVCPYGFPFRASAATLGDARRALWREGLQTLPWPDLPDAVTARAPAYYRETYLAHFLW